MCVDGVDLFRAAPGVGGAFWQAFVVGFGGVGGVGFAVDGAFWFVPGDFSAQWAQCVCGGVVGLGGLWFVVRVCLYGGGCAGGAAFDRGVSAFVVVGGGGLGAGHGTVLVEWRLRFAFAQV